MIVGLLMCPATQGNASQGTVNGVLHTHNGIAKSRESWYNRVMPTYVYRCSECGADRELNHEMGEDPIIECYMCDEQFMRRVPQATAAVFNGSGFYKTDSRKK